MPLLDIDFTTVPNEIQPIPEGLHVFEVASVPDIKPAKSGKGDNFVVSLKLKDCPGFEGRIIIHSIFLNDIGKTTAKRVALAAGLNPGKDGFRTEELVGRTLKAEVVKDFYIPEGKTEKEETRRIKEYVVPGEASKG